MVGIIRDRASLLLDANISGWSARLSMAPMISMPISADLRASPIAPDERRLQAHKNTEHVDVYRIGKLYPYKDEC